MIDPDSKLLAIVGPTASGKTALALELAREFDGEIVCADSRTVYRGLDIGAAKPTAAERAAVPHHLLDVMGPDEPLTAASFKVLAESAVADIIARGHMPMIVGGSGLYVYGLLYDFQFPAGARTEARAVMERESLANLVERLWREDPDRAAEIDVKNRRRVIRALETVGQPRERNMILGPNRLLLGLWPAQELLNKNIVQRVDTMLQIGLVDEVRKLVAKYGPNLEVFRSPGYAEILQYLAGEGSLEEARAAIILHTRQLAKRQLTWFKRNREIHWLDRPEQAKLIVKEFLDPGNI